MVDKPQITFNQTQKQDAPGRKLPNRMAHHFFQAAQEQMGASSLNIMLRLAGLERYVNRLPEIKHCDACLASEYARFQKEIRSYYGRGARGLLNRIGRRLFQRMVHHATLIDRLELFWVRSLPTFSRRKKSLDWLAGQLRQSGARVSVHTLDMDLVFVVYDNDVTCGQSTSEPICWVTQGMIQEAISWATSEAPDIEEICCQAAGGANCTFRIRFSPPL